MYSWVVTNESFYDSGMFCFREVKGILLWLHGSSKDSKLGPYWWAEGTDISNLYNTSDSIDNLPEFPFVWKRFHPTPSFKTTNKQTNKPHFIFFQIKFNKHRSRLLSYFILIVQQQLWKWLVDPPPPQEECVLI